MLKKLICIISILSILFTLTPSVYGTELPDNGSCGVNLSWILDENGTLLILGTGDMDDWNRSSNTPWYKSRKEIKKVVIENGVTSIGENAFYGCETLTDVSLPNTITHIKNKAFAFNISLTDMVLPDRLTYIGGSAFTACSALKVINIPDNVKYIGFNAFSLCNELENLTIPTTVERIGTEAFLDTKWYNNQSDGILYLNNWCLGYKGDMPKNTEIILNDGIIGIADYAFQKAYNLKSIKLPDSLCYIGTYAFEQCSILENINIPYNVITINEETFSMCKSLTSIEIPDNVTYIDNSAFAHCSSLTDITFSNNLTYIGEQAFTYCTALTNVALPDSITHIKVGAFSNCEALENISLPKTVECIESDILSDTKWYDLQADGVLYLSNWCLEYKGEMPENTEITLKNNTKGIADYAFSDCYTLKRISLPSSLTYIGKSAFIYCSSLRIINIPKNITSIEPYTFCGCESLISLSIPDNTTSIKYSAFKGCQSLNKITIPKNASYVDLTAFYGTAYYEKQSNGIVYLDNWCLGYKGQMPEGTEITLQSGTTGIADLGFSNYEQLKSITIPKSVKYIGDDSFAATSEDLIIYSENTNEVKNYAIENNIKFITPNANINTVKLSVNTSSVKYDQGLKNITIPFSLTKSASEKSVKTQIYVAAYKNDVLMNVTKKAVELSSTIAYKDEAIIENIFEKPDSVRIFVFDELNGITPLSVSTSTTVK